MSEIWKSQPPKVHRHWLDTILMGAQDKLSDWETNFIESIEKQLDKRMLLSQAQEEKLESIYAEKTS